MAIKFLKAWGCEVTAFSRSRSKEAAARGYGAHEYLATEEDGVAVTRVLLAMEQSALSGLPIDL